MWALGIRWVSKIAHPASDASFCVTQRLGRMTHTTRIGIAGRQAKTKKSPINQANALPIQDRPQTA